MALKIEADKGAQIDVAEAFLERADGTIRAAPGCRLSLGHPVHIDERTRLDFTLADGAVVDIAEGCYFGILCIFAAGGRIEIGPETTCYEATLRAVGKASIRIGRDCMLGGDVEINTSDFHTIFDLETKAVLNKAKDVVVEDHVWIANDCAILKGAFIERGSVIGARSLVTGRIPADCVAVGSPAKPIRHGIGWSRASPDDA